MRFLLLAAALVLMATLLGCRLKNILPGKAVLKDAQRSVYEGLQAAQVQYIGPARTAHPVPPLAVFGVQYAVDIVLVTKHPDWEMHEYARLDLPNESVWVAKDADRNGVQTITSSLPDLQGWLPEVPVRRIFAPLEVEDRSKGRDIDITLRYQNPKGQSVEVWTKGRMPKKPPGKRNGNTMGHSRDIVAAVLDLERFGSRVRAKMKIGDKSWGFQRILGLVPFKFLLRQTQGGVAIANYRLEPKPDGWAYIRPGTGGEDWPTASQDSWTSTAEVVQLNATQPLKDGQVASDNATNELTHDNGICQFRYTFVDGGLAKAQVTQAGLEEETFTMWIHPALPDLSRPFAGVATSHFRMDVGGQAGHGIGEMRAEWFNDDTVLVSIIPTHPHWLADRPMRSYLHYQKDGSVEVETIRIPSN